MNADGFTTPPRQIVPLRIANPTAADLPVCRRLSNETDDHTGLTPYFARELRLMPENTMQKAPETPSAAKRARK